MKSGLRMCFKRQWMKRKIRRWLQKVIFFLLTICNGVTIELVFSTNLLLHTFYINIFVFKHFIFLFNFFRKYGSFTKKKSEYLSFNSKTAAVLLDFLLIGIQCFEMIFSIAVIQLGRNIRYRKKYSLNKFVQSKIY